MKSFKKLTIFFLCAFNLAIVQSSNKSGSRNLDNQTTLAQSALTGAKRAVIVSGTMDLLFGESDKTLTSIFKNLTFYAVAGGATGALLNLLQMKEDRLRGNGTGKNASSGVRQASGETIVEAVNTPLHPRKKAMLVGLTFCTIAAISSASKRS